MNIALISDIHANLPALEAVLADPRVANADAVYHLGDLVGYAPWPNETVALIGERSIAGVAGNYDSTVAHHYEHCGCRYEDVEQEQLSHSSYQWTCEQVAPVTRRFLRALPFRMDVRPFGGHTAGPRLILVHGTPMLNTVYWTEDRNDDFCRKMAQSAGARPGDLIAFGHTHLPWQREVDGVKFANAGSVGRPKDGDPRAGFTLVDVYGQGMSCEHVRISYDVEATAAAIRASDLPDAFATFLSAGGRV